jgi:hypothetical protein
MELELRIEDNKYQIRVSSLINLENELKFKSELLSMTISTFDYRKNYIANTIEESVSLLTKELQRALRELLEL